MVKLRKILKHLGIHPSKSKKQVALSDVSNLFMKLSNHQLTGQDALKQCLPIADKFDVTYKWESQSHIMESSVYKKLYKWSISKCDEDDNSKNQDRLALYHLRKNNQPFIKTTQKGNWYPIKHQFQFDKALLALKSLIIRS